MSLVVVDVGEVLLLKRMLNHTAADNVKLHLNSNDITPGESDVVGAYTECDATGYGSKTLTGSSFTIGTTNGTSTATYALQTFTMTAAETVYGYYLTDNAGTTLLWAERFADAPYNIPSGGGDVKLTINISAA